MVLQSKQQMEIFSGVPAAAKKRSESMMSDLIHSIDQTLRELAAASIWGFVKSIIKKVRWILVLEGEHEGAQILDIISE